MSRTSLLCRAMMGIALSCSGWCDSVGFALTTPYAPDAWTRGNTADVSYFGWDAIETGTTTLGFGRILDDSTPDLGPATTATGTRIFQGNNGIIDPMPTTYGHRSGSSNYYSGFNDTDLANDTIESTAPASGAGGYTTVVLQVLGSPANDISDLEFAMTTAGWSLAKNLYGELAGGTAVFWQEWTAPGANLPFSIHLTSTLSSRSIESFQIDTFWSPSTALVNGRDSVGVPEPATVAICGAVAMAMAFCRRQSR